MTSSTSPSQPQRLSLLARWHTAIQQCNVPDIQHADFITRWLVIARACVFSMTLTSGIIGALLVAALGNRFGWTEAGLALLVVVGLLIAHATNNLVNDYIDTRRGVDTEDYPRGQYATHPILGGLTTPNRLLVAAAILTLLDATIMVYLAWARGIWVVAFAVTGFLLSMGYTGILKRFALGEITALTVWGPLMIGGTYYAIAGSLPSKVWWASLPYGLIVASVLIGKHIDKLESDRRLGIRTLPVLLGREGALRLLKGTFVLFYLLIFGLVFWKILGPWILLTLLASKRLYVVWKALSEPKPKEKPEDWPIWPLWYVAWSMYFNRSAGMWFILGLILNVATKAILGH